jgi:DNA repair protein RecO (recombination protein O)
VVFLTEDRGKKRGVAKHASASRKRFGGALEPLTRGCATYVERENRELVRLDRVEPSGTLLCAAEGMEAGEGVRVLGHASYFAELIDEWAPDGSPNERLFRLGSTVADALGRKPRSVDALARYFEYWLLRLQGVYPSIRQCPGCGEGLTGGASMPPREDVFLCRTCAPGGSGTRLCAEAMLFLKSATSVAPDRLSTLALAPNAARELETAHRRLINVHLDKDLKSARVLREMRQPR